VPPCPSRIERGVFRRYRVMGRSTWVIIDVPDTPRIMNNSNTPKPDVGPVLFRGPRGRPRGMRHPRLSCPRLSGPGAPASDACLTSSWATSSDMLVLADRGFYSYELWTDALETGAALVFRASANS